MMSHSDFQFAIWHPFGPHGRESAEQIIQRKRREIQANGWTLWSFQNRRAEVLEEWSRILSAVKGPVVFCSNSPGALDPSDTGTPAEGTHCRSYRLACTEAWLPLPEALKVPHPFKGEKKYASAFVVRQIVHPVEPFPSPTVQWFSKGEWLDTSVPTRGEYLIRRGGSARMRPVRAVLELQPPFLATVCADAA